MCGLGIFYSKYWLANSCEASFPGLLETLKRHLGTFISFSAPLEGVDGAQEIKTTLEWVPPPLNNCSLKLHACFFKSTMLVMAHGIMALPITKNLTSKLWRRLSHNSIISDKLLEYVKVVEIAHIQVLGRANDECTLQSLTFLRSKLHNRYTPPPTWTLWSACLHIISTLRRPCPINWQILIGSWRRCNMEEIIGMRQHPCTS